MSNQKKETDMAKRDPDGASHTLLRVMEKEPEAVMRVLHS
jgi:DNA-binding transcriptional regulator YiaG